jgi:hypothetical protein
LREPTLADLEDAAAGDNHRKWNRTAQQQAKVRKDRKAMFSIPVFDRIPLGKRDLTNQPVLGVLSADTDASFHDYDVVAGRRPFGGRSKGRNDRQRVTRRLNEDSELRFLK